MSHTKLFQQGKISQEEYENAQYLKDTGQVGLYKLYEQRLSQSAKEREHEGRSIQGQMADRKTLLTLRGHVLRAERSQ